MELENRRILITGASRGLGRALVTAFVAAGAKDPVGFEKMLASVK
jgi:NAD(P)-dependent dehydrogenase (short-subunit alcohol dehydrogenase family)